MKRIFFILFLFATSLVTYSQADDTLSTNIYQKNGNIGIGISTPEYLLDLKGDADGYSTLQRQFINLNNINNSAHSNVAVNLKSGTDDNLGAASFGVTANSYEANLAVGGFAYIYTKSNGISLRSAASNGIIKFLTAGEGDDFERMRIDSAGNIGIGTTSPYEKLEVNGNIKADSFLLADGTSLTSPLWDKTGGNISYTNGNVGIGNDSPQYKFQLNDENTQVVMGKHPVNEGTVISLYNSDGASAPMLSLSVARKDTYYNSTQLTKTDWAHIYGNSYTEGIGLIADHTDGFENGVYLTKEGNLGVGTIEPAAKLEVAGDIIADSFLLADGTSIGSPIWNLEGDDISYSNGYVGIGISTPEYLLDLKGDADGYSTLQRQFINLNNTNNSAHSNVAISLKSGTDDNLGAASFGVTANSYDANLAVGGFAYIYTRSNGISLRSVASNGIIKFLTAGEGDDFERMRIDSAGNVGIGTTSPSAKLQVSDGDIYISDINKGIIMTSPDGQCWRGVLDNNGQLNFTQVTCPSGNVVTTSVETVVSKSTTTSIDLYPNPTNGEFTIEFDTYNDLNSLSYEIYSIEGRLIETAKIYDQSTIVNLTGYSSGNYIVKIKNGDSIIESKEIIKN